MSAGLSRIVEEARLTPSMLAMLMQHAEGSRPTRAGVKELRSLEALRARQLIYFNRRTRPTHTTATTRGRQVIEAVQALRENGARGPSIPAERLREPL